MWLEWTLVAALVAFAGPTVSGQPQSPVIQASQPQPQPQPQASALQVASSSQQQPQQWFQQPSSGQQQGKARYRTMYACEDRQLTLDCESGYQINLIRANYGRFSIAQCNEQGQLDLSIECMSPITFRIMLDRCQNKQKCSVTASSALFGDKCPKTPKYLEVHFQCQPDPDVIVDLRNTSTVSPPVRQRQQLHIQQPSKQSLAVFPAPLQPIEIIPTEVSSPSQSSQFGQDFAAQQQASLPPQPQQPFLPSSQDFNQANPKQTLIRAQSPPIYSGIGNNDLGAAEQSPMFPQLHAPRFLPPPPLQPQPQPPSQLDLGYFPRQQAYPANHLSPRQSSPSLMLAGLVLTMALLTVAFLAYYMRPSTKAGLRRLGNMIKSSNRLNVDSVLKNSASGVVSHANGLGANPKQQDLLVIKNRDGHQFLYATANSTKINSSSPTHILTGSLVGQPRQPHQPSQQQHQGTLHQISSNQGAGQQHMYCTLSETGAQTNNYYYDLLGCNSYFQQQQQQQQRPPPQPLRPHPSQYRLDQQIYHYN